MKTIIILIYLWVYVPSDDLAYHTRSELKHILEFNCDSIPQDFFNYKIGLWWEEKENWNDDTVSIYLNYEQYKEFKKKHFKEIFVK